MTVKDVLVDAKEYIVQYGWCQETYQREDGAVCIEGAFTTAEMSDIYDNDTVDRAMYCIGRAVETDNILRWNDQPVRTKQDILDAFDRAIQYAEEN